MNLCIFSGRLTKDCECRYTQSGKAVLNFSMAVDVGYGDNKSAVFLNCVLWDKEKLVPHLTKGKPIIIRGEYTERKYQDRNGQDRRAVEIIVRDVEFQQGQPRQDGNDRPPQRMQERHTGAAATSDAYDGDSVPF